MRRLARLAMLACLFVLAVAGCEKRVVREKSWSQAQFPQYRGLPRERAQPEKPAEDWGKNIMNALGKLNPFD